ncbi:MAG TPA: hypothetical protein PLJ21_04030, partial [Pseudobdellovibrionaceae bacterium]|nr:hypothetical protein [Pseudobdellovibrionaceae bacterium]
MKFFALIASLSIVSLSQAGVEEYVYENITRRTGGQEINQPMVGASKQILITLKAEKFPIVIHD